MSRRVPAFVVFLLSSLAFSPFFPATAQDSTLDELAPNANRWTLIVYATGDEQDSPSVRHFQRLAEVLRAASDRPSNVVVFSPFEESPTRRPTENVLRETLAWLRDADSPSETLELPAMRSDASEPVELRFILGGKTQGDALLLPDASETSQPVKIDDFIAAVRDVGSPCERALFFFNLNSEATRRGSAVNLGSLALDGDATQDDETIERRRQDFPQSYFRTLFFGQDDATFFGALANAFEGEADVLNADGIVTALETLEYLRDVASETPSFQRLGQDFPLTRSQKAKPVAPRRFSFESAPRSSAEGGASWRSKRFGGRFGRSNRAITPV